MKKPKVMVLRAAGTNCDLETAAALELVGGQVERVHINLIKSGKKRLLDHDILVLLFDPPVDDRVLGGQLQFAHLALAVDAAPLLQLGRAKRGGPIIFESVEPGFEGMRSVNALGTVRLHPLKKGDRRTRTNARNQILT